MKIQTLDFAKAVPYIPDNVTAETELVTPMGPELGQYRFAHDTVNEIGGVTGRELADELGRFSRLTARVVESTNPDVEVGDEATVLVLADGKSEADIKADIAACAGPRKRRLIARALGGRSACGAVYTANTVPKELRNLE